MRYTMILLLMATTAQADDWFEDWQAERNTERRHQEMMQEMRKMNRPQDPAVIIVPAEPLETEPRLPDSCYSEVEQVRLKYGLPPSAWCRPITSR